MRRLLTGLLAASLIGAAAWAVMGWDAATSRCTPAEVPTAEMRIASEPDDGCRHLWIRFFAAKAGGSLLVVDALALVLALRVPPRWRAATAALPLAWMVVPMGVTIAFAAWWTSSCGPVESYVGACASLRWLYLPWVVFSLAVAVAIVVHARRSRPAREA